MALDEEEVRTECKILKTKGISDIAVVGVFSPLDISGRQEARVKEIILDEMPGADVVLSRESEYLMDHCKSIGSRISDHVLLSWPIGIS
jgi:N-methylhydantoinase A/oxoprolinase/acetone carboxylase beta subunit